MSSFAYKTNTFSFGSLKCHSSSIRNSAWGNHVTNKSVRFSESLCSQPDQSDIERDHTMNKYWVLYGSRLLFFHFLLHDSRENLVKLFFHLSWDLWHTHCLMEFEDHFLVVLTSCFLALKIHSSEKRLFLPLLDRFAQLDPKRTCCSTHRRISFKLLKEPNDLWLEACMRRHFWVVKDAFQGLK